jgi:hypothetical protein
MRKRTRALGYAIGLAGFSLIIWQTLSSPSEFDLKLRGTILELGSPTGDFAEGRASAGMLSRAEADLLIEEWRERAFRERLYIGRLHQTAWGGVLMLSGMVLISLSSMQPRCSIGPDEVEPPPGHVR